MPKPLADILKGVKSSTIVSMELPDNIDPHTGSKMFQAKHKIEKHADRVGNEGEPYTAPKIKSAVKQNARHGYEPGKDEKVYQ